MAEKYIAPKLDLSAYHCPHCGVYSAQFWRPIWWYSNTLDAIVDWKTATCTHCRENSFWRGDAMIFPSGGTAPLPNADLSADIKHDYEEARSIVSRSPRGAAALLRLCIQKL